MKRLSNAISLALAVMVSTPFQGAHAQENGRLEVPGVGLAVEDDAASIATNPGLSVFDPDGSISAHYRTNLDTARSTFNFQTVGGGLGFGALYESTPDGLPYWVVSSSMAFRIDQQTSFGTNIRWHLPSTGDGQFVGWDLGLGYRPFSWLGFGAVARNLGVPESADLPETYGVGAVVRPWGEPLAFGVDALQRIQSDGTTQDAAEAHLRIQPWRGLRLRLTASTDGAYAGGLEFSFGEWREGLYYGQGNDLVFGVETVDTPEQMVVVNRHVPVFEIDGRYPYESRRSLFADAAPTYPHLVQRLRAAAQDPAVVGAVLRLKSVQFSFAQLEEIRALVEDISLKRGPVLAYLDGDGSNAAYFLASAADRVAIHPAGDLFLIGLSAEMQFLRGALDNLGVEPEFYKRSDYKSGPEQYTRHEPSEASSRQMNALLDDLHNAMVDAVADGRKGTEGQARTLIDEGPYTAEDAFKAGLVDAVMYPDGIEAGMNELIAKKFALKDDYREMPTADGWQSPKQIAAVFITGVITSGESASPGLFSGGSTGSDTIVRAITQAREKDSVAALVIRVDSPGGSAFASDAIWRAVRRFQATGRPVVVSMGGTAASGGYYVAASADKIYAEATTITGSIGVYGGKISMASLYDKIGVDVTLLSRGRNAAMFSSAKPFDPVEGEAMDRLIEDTYKQFKSRVATGRKLSEEEVEKVAQGRVWTGSRAQKIGLVDEIGGIFEAIAEAKSLAELSDKRRVDVLTFSGQGSSANGNPMPLLGAIAPELGKIAADIAALETLKRLESERTLLLLPYRLELQ